MKLAQWSATRPDVFPEAWCVPASRGHRRLDGVEASDDSVKAVAIASAALVGVRLERTQHAIATTENAGAGGLLQNSARPGERDGRPCGRSPTFPGGETVLDGTVGAGCVAPSGRARPPVAAKAAHNASRVQTRPPGASTARRASASTASAI